MSYLQIVSGVIALSSITSNLIVCVLFLCKKIWLKRPYKVFLLNLAVTDMMTGFLMFITPGMIVEVPIKIPNNPLFGFLYCKVLWSRWLLFALGAVSVYTSLVLTVERWTAICRPFKYRLRFASKCLIGYIVLIWIVGLTVSSVGGNLVSYHSASSNITSPRCIAAPPIKSNLDRAVSTVAVTLKFFVPSVVILVLYAFAIAKVKGANQFNRSNHRSKAVKNVSKMAVVASIALIICWSPNQVYFVLYKFNQVKLFTVFHNITILVVFLNSTLNPFIYALWGKQFRNGFKELLLTIRCSTRNLNTRSGLDQSYQLETNIGSFVSSSIHTKH